MTPIDIAALEPVGASRAHAEPVAAGIRPLDVMLDPVTRAAVGAAAPSAHSFARVWPPAARPARSAALVPLVAALVAGLAQLLTSESAMTVVEAGATGAGVAATGVVGWSVWRAATTDRGRLAALAAVLGGWTLTQAARVGLGPAPAGGAGQVTIALGALAAPLLAAVALVTLPRPVSAMVADLAGPADEPADDTRAALGTAVPSTARRAAGAPLGARLANALDTARTLGWDTAGFDVHYQPIVRLSDGAVVGLEALARWNEPGRGPVPPLTFVAAAERRGLVAALDEFVLRRACDEVAAAMPADPGGAFAPRLHVNVSASRLSDPGLPEVFDRALGASGLDPARLVIEITETYRITDLAMAARLLNAVRALGPSVAMDDVGAGHTTLAALHQLPVNVVKLDRALIENPLGPGRAARLGRSVITVARSLGAVVVAEGIERRAQRADLTLLGCELGQGFLFARPAPLAALGPMLRPAGPPGTDPPGDGDAAP